METTRARTRALYFCFFLSGVAGLVYEVLWARYLALYVGSTAVAQIIVLATFMGGLALGGHTLGRVADRVAAPLRFYALLELGIGLYALVAFEPVYFAVRQVFIALVRALGLNPGGLAAGKAVACVMTILLPSILMGGTLPAIGRHIIRSMASVGPKISRLYFLNSIGAVVGCLLAGFYLIHAYGLQFSMYVGALLNLASAAIAFVVFKQEEYEESPAPPAAEPQSAEPPPPVPHGGGVLSHPVVALLLSCVALSGAVSMMYEVAWIRLLTLVLGSSTYSFSLMLATFILGLSLGGLLLSLRRKTTGYQLIFGWSEIGVGLLVLVSLPFYVRLPYVFNQVAASLVRDRETFGLYQFSKFFLCVLVMFAPTVLQGITLPAATQVLTRSVSSLGRRVGFIFAVNTIGTLAGVVFAGFFGLPRLGLKGTLELAVALNLVLGLAVLATAPRASMRRYSLAGAAACAVLVVGWYGLFMNRWDRDVLSSGIYRYRERIPSFAELQNQVRKRETVFYRDGIDASIAVQDIGGEEPDRMLVINGKVDATLTGDLATQKSLAHLPMLMRPDSKNVLIIGIGSGAVIGSVLAYDEVERVDVIEISRDVIEASRLFAEINGEYWNDPRVNVYWEDAKTFLEVTDRRYDAIISEPTNPWIAGVAGLFSIEFFETCREHLKPDGLFVQWMQTYELEDSTFYMMLGTFTRVFPHYTMWNPMSTDTILVGATAPHRPDLERMAARASRGGVARDLAKMGVSSLLPVLGMQMADRADRPSHVQWLDLHHSDFFPLLDYTAPRGFFVGNRAEGVRRLDERMQSPANSDLWIEAWLEAHPPTAEQFREYDRFIRKYRSGIFENQALVWAREWSERYPDDVEAALALAREWRPDHAPARRRLALSPELDEAERFAAGKLRVKLGIEDYRATRNFLNAQPADETLADLERLFAEFPNAADPDLHRWRGQLAYDLGRYDAAVRSLSTALNALAQSDEAEAEWIETGTLLCRILAEHGSPTVARQAYNDVLASHEDHLEVWLTRALVRDAEQRPTEVTLLPGLAGGN